MVSTVNNFVYSTQQSFQGPWLLDRNSLLQLNHVLETIFDRMSEAACDALEKDLAAELETRLPDNMENYIEWRRSTIQERHTVHRTVRVTLSDSKYVQSETIYNILSLPEVLDESPTSLEATLQYKGLSVEVKIPEYYKKSLSIRTSPEANEIARESFVQLQQWAVSFQAPVWQQLWTKLDHSHWLVWILALAISFPFIIPNSDEVKEQFTPRANEILIDGISNAEQKEVLEILLRLNLKLPVEETKSHPIPAWFQIISVGGLLVSVMASIRPSTVIGIGRNEKKIRLWKGWMRLVGITIPGFVFASFIWPYIAAWIKTAL